MPTNEEIKKIVDLHKSGMSQGQIAKEMSKGKSTINRVLQGLGLTNGTDTERSGTKNATEAKATYDRERRMALNDLWFEKIEAMLLEADDANTLRALATPYGVASDKRAQLEPLGGCESKTGLEEMLEAIHTARQNNDMETSSG